MLVANENVLLLLYEKMFPTKSDPIVKEMLSNENRNSFFGSSVKRIRGTVAQSATRMFGREQNEIKFRKSS